MTGEVELSGAPWVLPLKYAHAGVRFKGDEPRVFLEVCSVDYHKLPKTDDIMWDNSSCFDVAGSFAAPEASGVVRVAEVLGQVFEIDAGYHARQPPPDELEYHFEGNVWHFEWFADHRITMRATGTVITTVEIAWSAQIRPQCSPAADREMQLDASPVPLEVRLPSKMKLAKAIPWLTERIAELQSGEMTLAHQGTRYGTRRFFLRSVK